MVFLLVAFMFLLFITISYFKKKKATELDVEPSVSADSVEDKIFLHPSHTYAKILSDDLVEVGPDEFAKRAFGKLDDIELPKVGSTLKQGEIAWRARVGTRFISQRMPVDGVVQAVNPEPGVFMSWVLKVKPSQLKENMANLIQGSSVSNWLKSARTKFLADYSGNLVPAMQDGGELVYGFARYLTDDEWKDFCKEFFNCEDCENCA